MMEMPIFTMMITMQKEGKGSIMAGKYFDACTQSAC